MSFSRRTLLVVLALIADDFRTSASAADTNVTALMLRPAIKVDSRGVTLRQLIEGDAVLLPDLKLTNAPVPGKTLELTRTQIAEAARRVVPDLLLTNWSGPDKVRISRRLRSLEGIELKELLTSTLEREKVHDRGEVELRLAQPWVPVEVPDEPLQVKLQQLPSGGITPNFILRFELVTDAESVGIWQVPLQAKLWREVWVARSAQPRGRLVHEADLVTERRDVLTLRDALTAIDFQDSSLELTQNLEAGAPLVAYSVRPRPVIRRGKLVDAVVQDGSLLITLKAEALEDGLPGQMIRLRNDSSKREFRGKVQNEQTVLVPL